MNTPGFVPAKQALGLVLRLQDEMHKASVRQNADRVARLDRLIDMALTRYERRHAAHKQVCRTGASSTPV